MPNDLDQVWKALSDPTRRAILDALRNGPRTTTEIVEGFPKMTRHAVMKHIDVLREAWLVITREEGRRRINSLNHAPIRQIYERWMGPFSEIWSSTLLRIKEDFETKKPKLIVVSGLPGSGKSTVAEGLAEKLALPFFSVDPVVSAIIRGGAERNASTDLTALLVVETLASEQLGIGISVIVDAVNATEEVREMWRTLSNNHGAELVVIECVLDREIHKRRVEARVRNLHGFPELTWDDVENRRDIYLPWKEEGLILDTADNAVQNLEKALAFIEQSK